MLSEPLPPRRWSKNALRYAVSGFMPHGMLSLLGWGVPGFGIKEQVRLAGLLDSLECGTAKRIVEAPAPLRSDHNTWLAPARLFYD